MASGAIAALRAELQAARSSLLPIVQGFWDLAAIPNLSADTASLVAQERTDADRRLAAIDQALLSMDALEADGYPEVERRTVPADIFYELVVQQQAIAAAMGELNAAAVTATITPGEPEPQ